ncbi:nucleoside/nucleotide kinase family protein [Dactylosporangium matsuzakiense]|uniref:Nucleoside/nucleotide kinase family protein n=2 Tax=Dactylosporangium matsuzakiense TaxID=53360 RepID=A0A9W6KK56_9ACTN|nr:nucleoside/nucleotide kinase family protein [Dactylosporangium matsuzakiense]GLL01746.1 nucleoside/nucleotide kinase family protein [Dactylosporangium matsuzakiense]
MRQPDVLQPALDVVVPFVRGRQGRSIVGICGPPAAGKSTLSSALSDALNVHDGLTSVAVPMDGFHLSNVELGRLGLTDRKGAPETFDAAGFVHLLRRLRAGEDLVYAPSYSRTLHESIGGVIPVPADVRVIVVEGNYLLLDQGPWASVRGLLDLVLYLDAPDAVRQESLLRRQMAKGLELPAAQDWVFRSDERNAAVIAGTRDRADLILTR